MIKYKALHVYATLSLPRTCSDTDIQRFMWFNILQALQENRNPAVASNATLSAIIGNVFPSINNDFDKFAFKISYDINTISSTKLIFG